MTISPQPDHGLEFSSVIESHEDREPVQILSALILRSGEYLRMCSWCKAVDVEGKWLPTREAVEALGLFRTPRLPAVSHTICAPCRDRLERKLRFP
jgi:hypothetical protein